MAGKKLTDIQKIARKVGKVLKNCAIQCNEKFKYENFRAPDAEEKMWIYTDACKMAMSELNEDEQLFLIDYYFVRGNKMFKEAVSGVVQRALGKTSISTKCPKQNNDSVHFIKVGNVFYNMPIEDVKEEASKYIRSQVSSFMYELISEIKSKNQRRITNIKNKYSVMHLTSELERKNVFSGGAGDDSVSNEQFESFVSYSDLDDLSRSLIRDAVLYELNVQATQNGEFGDDSQQNKV